MRFLRHACCLPSGGMVWESDVLKLVLEKYNLLDIHPKYSMPMKQLHVYLEVLAQ